MIGSRKQSPSAKIGMAIGFVRMDADARPDVGLAFGSGDDRVPFALTR
jgi:hypothetical protein